MTEKEFIKLIGEKIEQKRTALGLSREALGQKSELTRMHIYRIEKGEHAMGIGILRRIAKALEVSVTELINVE